MDGQGLKPLACWLERDRDPTNLFPISTRIALGALSCPVMSSECVRVFFEAKRLVAHDRSQLGAETNEAVQCKKN